LPRSNPPANLAPSIRRSNRSFAPARRAAATGHRSCRLPDGKFLQPQRRTALSSASNMKLYTTAAALESLGRASGSEPRLKPTETLASLAASQPLSCRARDPFLGHRVLPDEPAPRPASHRLALAKAGRTSCRERCPQVTGKIMRMIRTLSTSPPAAVGGKTISYTATPRGDGSCFQ